MDEKKLNLETPVGWRHQYCTGNAQIDNQHRKIFSLIEKIRLSVIEGSRQTEQGISTVKELVEYANLHLDTEEKAMTRCDFPFIEQHSELHRRYRQQIAIYIKRCKNLDDPVINDIFDFLKFWWTNHILSADKQLAAYFSLETVNLFKKKLE